VAKQKTSTGNRFGEIAVREGFASRTAVRECLEIQTKLRSFGVEPKRLGEIMVEKGFLRDPDVRSILEIQKLGGSRMESRSGAVTDAGRRLKTSQAAVTKDLPTMPRIPGYEIMELLGEGGMGMVYKARQKSLDRVVALKILPARAAKEAAFIKRFISEARTVARLNHENIIAGIDVGEADGTYYFAMEHVEGESVADMIDRLGPLEERTALSIAAQMARALTHAHKHGLVHRDIKPQNILVTRNALAKLCDLGLAKVQSEGATDPTGVPVGTPHYLSPEQARGEADVDIRSDIYSLGASLYHMLTGETPFEGQSPMVLMTKHLTEEPTPARKRKAGVSRAASDLVAAMMAKEKEDRHQTPGELLDDIERVLAGKKLSGSARMGASSRRRSARKSGTRARPDTSDRQRPDRHSGSFDRAERDREPPPRRPRGGTRTLVRAKTGSTESVALALIPLVILIMGGYALYVLFIAEPSFPGVDHKPPSEATEREAEAKLREYRALQKSDPAAARTGYEAIMRDYPGTHAASLARDYESELGG